MIRIRFDTRALERGLSDLRRKVVPQAASRALNRTIDTTRSQAVKKIAGATKIKQRDVRRHTTVQGSRPSRLTASLEAQPYAPNLSYFRATPNKQGVAASAWEGRKTYKGAFALRKNSKVVKRVTPTKTSKKRLKPVFGPSVRRTFMRDDVQKHVLNVARQRFPVELERDLSRRLSKLG